MRDELRVALKAAPAAWLLWAGAAIGLGLAITGLASRASDPSVLRRDVVAVVNGVPISRAEYDSALRGIRDAEHREPSSAEKKAAVDRLVEEELLIEQGIALGMPRSDGPTRHALLGAFFSAARARADSGAPSDRELEAFFAQVSADLVRPGKMRLRQLVVRATRASEETALEAKAAEAVRRLRAHEPFEAVDAALGSKDDPPLPDRPLAFDELRGLVGPITALRALELAPGEVSEPLGNARLLRVLQLFERGPPETPSFRDARDAVLARYRQRAGDRAFARTMARLRASAEIRSLDVLP